MYADDYFHYMEGIYFVATLQRFGHSIEIIS
jgi:hypothetical protein